MALSTHSSRPMVAKMLKAGAAGYMVKESAFSELEEGIRSMLEDGSYLGPKVAGVILADYVNMLSGSREDYSSEDGLTSREREVLQLVTEGNTTKTIAAALNISTKTIDSHRARIMEKLGIHSVAQLTKYAIREGLTAL